MFKIGYGQRFLLSSEFLSVCRIEMLQIMKKQQIKRVENMLALKAAGWEKSETEVP